MRTAYTPPFCWYSTVNGFPARPPNFPELYAQTRLSTCVGLIIGVVHAWVGQIVTFFAYSSPSRPLGSLTPTQPDGDGAGTPPRCSCCCHSKKRRSILHFSALLARFCTFRSPTPSPITLLPFFPAARPINAAKRGYSTYSTKSWLKEFSHRWPASPIVAS